MRRARTLAFLFDILLCLLPADALGLLATFLLTRREGASDLLLPAVWALLGAAALLFFLLRDARGGRARRWLALEVRDDDGGPPGVWASVRRNAPLLVPLWNLREAWPVLRDGKAQRLADRRLGLQVVETS